MDSTCACDPLGKDLASFCYELAECLYIFIINSLILIGTELAYFSSSVAASSFIHCDYLLSLKILFSEIVLERDVAIVQRCESCRYLVTGIL